MREMFDIEKEVGAGRIDYAKKVVDNLKYYVRQKDATNARYYCYRLMRANCLRVRLYSSGRQRCLSPLLFMEMRIWILLLNI